MLAVTDGLRFHQFLVNRRSGSFVGSTACWDAKESVVAGGFTRTECARSPYPGMASWQTGARSPAQTRRTSGSRELLAIPRGINDHVGGHGQSLDRSSSTACMLSSMLTCLR